MNKFSSSYHFVTPSPWPILGSLILMSLLMSLMKFFYMGDYMYIIYSLMVSILVFFQWWRDVVREGEYQGFHTNQVVYMMRWSFMLFIVSELFFFLSFFWSYFHYMLSPPIECGMMWPPVGVNSFDPYGFPMLNSFILVTSGMTVTVAHHMMILESFYKKYFLLLTIILGLIFSLFQGLEYYYSSFTISDSVYGSMFFMMTGFHGIHVIVGTIFLSHCLIRMMMSHFMSNHHVGFEAASWYWHFVDVVWLFLYVIVYWWSS